jgi:hypothetical protein
MFRQHLLNSHSVIERMSGSVVDANENVFEIKVRCHCIVLLVEDLTSKDVGGLLPAHVNPQQCKREFPIGL